MLNVNGFDGAPGRPQTSAAPSTHARPTRDRRFVPWPPRPRRGRETLPEPRILIMIRFHRLSAAVLAAIALTTLTGTAAQERDRARIPDKYRWDLTAIYPSDDAWRNAKEALAAEIPKIGAYKGTLAGSGPRLADALELASRLSKELAREYVYASMMSDQDTRVSKYQGMQQEMAQLAAAFGTETAFIEPEILKIEPSAIARVLAEEPRLKVYRFYIEDIQRRRAHTGTDNEERLLASASVMAGTPSNVYTIFSDADFPYPSVTLSDGTSVRLDTAAFNVLRGLPNREDRAKVMSACRSPI